MPTFPSTAAFPATATFPGAVYYVDENGLIFVDENNQSYLLGVL